jgi:hypothetical protein
MTARVLAFPPQRARVELPQRHPERLDVRRYQHGSATITWRRVDEAAILRALAAIEDAGGRP